MTTPPPIPTTASTTAPTPTAPQRRSKPAHRGTVIRREQLTPDMVRVVFGGDGLAEFECGEFTDHYVKLLFPRPDVEYSQPFDPAVAESEVPREHWPVTRTYTIRQWDAEKRELAMDFVVHGSEGLAGPWAAAAQPGDELWFRGPGGAYRPESAADWHLLVGDESALPAIAAALERLPEGARATALIEVAGPQEQQPLTVPPSAELRWLQRNGSPVGQALVDAVTAFDVPAGTGQYFVHGEAGFVKEVRRILRVERQVPREQLSISGYWRLGHNEDGWQSSKRDWNAQVEAEQEATPAPVG